LRKTILFALGFAPVLILDQSPPSEEDATFAEFLQFLNTKVRIASRLLQTQEEAPSVVSVITREDIERFGWRDLIDILRTVPGFDFANDGTNLIGLSVRGVWAHEGKALLLVDGVPMSPFHNGNVGYYGQFPAESIHRVEIIRGPGSAVYGQFAGTTVIAITTRNMDDPEGGRFTARGISMGAGNHGGGAFLEATGRVGTGRVALSVGYQSSPFSNRDYVDSNHTGRAIPMTGGDGQRQVTFLSADLQVLDTRIHLVRNEPLLNQSPNNGSGASIQPPPNIPQGAFMAAGRIIQGATVQRDMAIGSQWSLLPRFEVVQNTGGSINPAAPASSGVNNSGTSRERLTGELGLRWHPRWPAVLLLGGGIIRDFERSIDVQNQGGMLDPVDPSRRLAQVIWHTRYGFAQYTQQAEHWGFTLGGRYEDNPINHAFAPRLGLTYADGPFNIKALYGEAFRVPTIFQTYSTFFDFRGYLKPELIRTSEIEMGWKFRPNLQARLNLYRLSVTRTISFGLDNAGFYIQNFGNFRTSGVEAGLEWQEATHGGFCNVSYTRPSSDSDPFFLSADRSKPLGMSALKANLGAYFRRGDLSLAPSLQYGGSRPGQTAASAHAPTTPGSLLPTLVETESFPARLTLNLAATWRNLRPGMDLRFSLQNLTNADTPLLQPYYGGHSALPAFDRRATLDLTWHF